MREFFIFDIETNGLLEEVSKIHCACISHFVDGQLLKKFILTESFDILKFFNDPNKTLVGHNIIRYDIPVIEKIIGIKVKARLWDTLGLSWYLYPYRKRHGLEFHGEDLGVEKPIVEDWENLTIQEYIHRCSEDVEINSRLFFKQWRYLSALYDGDEDQIERLIGYLSFKLDCAKEQEQVKWKLDIEKCQNTLNELAELEQDKLTILKSVMPQKISYRIVKKPSKMYKKDGTLSTIGWKWIQILESHDLPLDYGEDIKIEKGREEPNPGSYVQLKEWLTALGWRPKTFKESKSTKEEVPQLSLPNGEGLCNSVKELYPICPELEVLDGLYIISHRIGILKGFLKNVDEQGFLKAQVKGFTNTLRFQHTTLANLPKITKPYSKDIRACLIVPDEDHILCGSDMSSLEDNTKQHFMYFFDPKYVTEMRVPGFDPHLDIAVFSKLMTEEDERLFKELKNKENLSGEEKSILSNLNITRSNAKTVNFGAVYGAGPPKIAQTLKCELSFAKKLHTAYWERNKSVKQVANSVRTKIVGKDMWLFNPISQFWYSLRAEKDKFSTLNQGSGVYCFDLYVREVRKSGIKICGQFHDEIAFPLLKECQDKVTQVLNLAIEEVNKEVNLNVELGISIDFGKSYAEIH